MSGLISSQTAAELIAETWAKAKASSRAATITEAAALIRAADPMTLRILPTTPQGEVVVRDLREELAKLVEGLA